MNHAHIQYAPDIFELKDFKISPLARRIFGVVLNFSKKNGRAYVCRNTFSQLLRCRLNSVTNSMKELVDEGLIKRTGEMFNILFPIIEVTEKGQALIRKKESPTPHQIMWTPTSNDVTNKKKEKEELRKQTAKKVCSQNFKEKSLREKLQAFGIAKNQAKRLMGRYNDEKIKQHVAHLRYLLDRGDKIISPAGWLVNAIKKDFKPCAEQAKQQQAAQEQRTSERYQRAKSLLRDAERYRAKGELERAKSFAQKSLARYHQNEAQELLSQIEADIKKKLNLQKAQSRLSPEEQQRIFDEALEARRKHPFSIKQKLGEFALRMLARADIDDVLASST